VATVTTRHAERRDIAVIAEWNAAMAWETEQKRLDIHLLTRGVTAVFDDSRRGFYMIAEHDGRPAGCLLVTYEWSDWRNGDFWWIQSVYVAQEARRSAARGGRRCRGSASVRRDGKQACARYVSEAWHGSMPLPDV
jgi:hypothetical protein